VIKGTRRRGGKGSPLSEPFQNFRMNDRDWNMLDAHFKERRIPIGTGIRMVLVEYMKNQGLLK
jgi:hypothetical protein